MRTFDYIIVTHIPAFYKVNLYNEISKKHRILVVFLAYDTMEKRSADFVNLKDAKFSYEILSKGNLQSRNIFSNIRKLSSIIRSNQYKRLLLSGWDLVEFWYLAMLSPKHKNCLALESTIFESTTKGIKGRMKKVFLSRISTVFASGSLQVKLLQALNFRGEIRITKGVGIINKPHYEKVKRTYQKKFLYVGRLTKAKNLETLIKVFNELQDYQLTIVGDGEEKRYLQSIANKNIVFKPPIENLKLQYEFLDHDFLILPSVIEPWGLVVEEALYFGLPVLVSERCGSVELIKHGVNGYIFDPLNPKQIKSLILSINNDVYENLLNNVNSFSFQEKDSYQAKCYDFE